MSFNIDEERTKLIQLINDETFDFLIFADKNTFKYDNPKINFLWQVLALTFKYPQIELYLKNLLDHFTVDILNNILFSSSMLHYMAAYPFAISLNSFEMVINYGINVNIQNDDNYTVTHALFMNQCDNHIYNILNLLINHGVNLNIIAKNDETVLDIAINRPNILNEETKNCIMVLIDCGGTTNNPRKKNNIKYDFAECYKCSSIKLAIKK